MFFSFSFVRCFAMNKRHLYYDRRATKEKKGKQALFLNVIYTQSQYILTPVDFIIVLLHFHNSPKNVTHKHMSCELRVANDRILCVYCVWTEPFICQLNNIHQYLTLTLTSVFLSFFPAFCKKGNNRHLSLYLLWSVTNELTIIII